MAVMDGPGIGPTLGAFVLAFGLASAHAQTSTLEPFAFEAQVAVGTVAGRRPLFRAELRLVSPESDGTRPHLLPDDTATPEPLDGRLTALLQRDHHGVLLRYAVQGLAGERPRFWLQNGTRWVEPALSGFDAPAQGDVVRGWRLDDLCSVAVTVSGSFDAPIERLRLHAFSDVWASGFDSPTEGVGALPVAEGFLRTTVDGEPAVVGEVLVPAGEPLTLLVDVLYQGGLKARKALALQTNPVLCQSDLLPQDLPPVVMPPPAAGQLDLAFRLAADPTAPTDLQPWVSYISTRLIADDQDSVEMTAFPDEDGVARAARTLVAGAYSLDVAAALLWPDGTIGSLQLGTDALGAAFSPRIPLPLSPGPQKGFYPDLSIVVGDAEVESLALDDVFAVGEGTLTPYGCLTSADLSFGQAGWVNTKALPAPMLSELGTPTPAEPRPAEAFGPIVPGTERYRLAALEGSWRESMYLLAFDRPPAAGRSGVQAYLEWTPPVATTHQAAFTPGTPLTVPPRELPLGAVTVKLRVLDPSTGQPRPFFSPEVSVVVEDASMGSLFVRATGDQALRDLHHVVVPSLPGVHDLTIRAWVPRDPSRPDEVGDTIVSALPSLKAVPFRAPRPDGSCSAICNDPGVNVYWDDDLSPPVLELDEVPVRVYQPFVDVTGVAFDESPIVRVASGDAVATLDGDDTSRRRAFTIRIPVDEHTQTVTLVVRDRCGGEATVVRPVSLWTNTPPVIEPLRLSAREGAHLEASLNVVDPDVSDEHSAQVLTYALEDDASLPGASRPTLDPISGALSWTPGYDQSGIWTFRVTVSDGLASDEAEVVVEVEEVNRPPVIEQVGTVPVSELLAFSVAEGERLALSIEASDPDGDEVTLRAEGVDGTLPAGLSLSPQGALVFTPDFDQAGDHVVEVVASDGRGGEDRKTLLLRVDPVNRAPVVEGPSFAMVAEGEWLEVSYVAHDPDGEPLTWSLEPEALLARGVVLESSGHAARLTWTPGFDDAGDYVLTVTAVDPQGATGQVLLGLQVTNTNRPPQFAPVEPPVAAGWPGGFDVVASDPDGQEVACTAAQLPEGMTWDAGRRRVSWNDLLWPEGPLRVTIVCSDGALDGVLEVDVVSQHFDLVGGCDCAASGAGPLAFLALALALRRRRAR